MFRSLFPSLVATSGSTAAEKDGAATSSQEAVTSKADDAAGTENKAVANRIQKMDSIIRRKLHGTGAQYNMKVVIRGERGVGKTTLLRRLQGLPFEEKYTPTPEIQTTTINNWEYRKNQDVVKIEVWDVVDKGLARGGIARVPEGDDLENAVAGLPPVAGSAYLKTNVLIVTNEFELLGLLCRPARGGRALAVLDASVVNVYQGANAVIFMVDPYRPQTLDKVEKALAEAPVGLPAVILLNFRDKIEEDSAAKATEQAKTAPAERPARPSTTPADPPKEVANDGSAAREENVEAESKADAGSSGEKVESADDKAGAWEHIVTLESARLMIDRVRETDAAEGRGAGRRISLFDCSMKNCFGLRVLYTYLNVPFLELKRQSLLQQAQIAAETLEREHRELEGFIGGHNYANYMQHLLSSDIDPTAGRSVPANPPGRPMISSLPPPSSSMGDASIERRGSTDSHNKKDKKKKHHKDSKDKSSKKKHRHKVDKSAKEGREEPPEYEGKVTDPKEFTPVTKKTATEELEDFFGADSDGDSDKGIRDRNKVVNAMKPGALTATNAFDEGTDSDEMPAPSMSRLKRVTAPVKAPRQEEDKTPVMGRESDAEDDRQGDDGGVHQAEEKRTPNDEDQAAEITAVQAVEEIDGEGTGGTVQEEEIVTEKKGVEAQGLGLEADETAADVEDAVDDVDVVGEDTKSYSVTGTTTQLAGIVTVSIDKTTEMPSEDWSRAASEGSIPAVADDTVDGEHAEEGGRTAANGAGEEDVTISDQAGTGHGDDYAAGEDEEEGLEVEVEGNKPSAAAAGENERGDAVEEFDPGMTEVGDGATEGGIAEEFFAEGSSSGGDDGPHLGIDGSQTAVKSSRPEDLEERDDGEKVVRESNDTSSVVRVDRPPSPRFIASSVTQHEDTGFGFSRPTVAMHKGTTTASSEGLSEAAKAAVAAALANASATATTTSRSSSRRDHDGGKSRKKSRHKEKRRQDSGEEGVYREGRAPAGDNGIYTSSRSEKDRKGKRDSSSKRRHRKSPG